MFPPPGYVAYGAAQLRPSRGRGTATIWLYWAITAMTVFVTISLFWARSVLEDATADGDIGFRDWSKVTDALDVTTGMEGARSAIILAAIILTCLWSKRIADNAKVRGVRNVSPGMACGGWWIPVGNIWLGWMHLRRSAAGTGTPTSHLNMWQGFALASWIFSVVLGVGATDVGPTASSVRNASDIFLAQAVSGIFASGLLAVAAYAATKAIRELDRGVTRDT